MTQWDFGHLAAARHFLAVNQRRLRQAKTPQERAVWQKAVEGCERGAREIESRSNPLEGLS